MKRWLWMGAAVVVLAFATGAQAGSQENTMVLYGAPDRDWVAAVAAKFEKETGIKTPWIRASSNEMYAKIEAEKANPQGDVWFGGTGDPHFAAAEAGLTEPYCSPKMPELREWMRDPIGGCRVIGLYAGPLGWAVNEGVLKKLGKPMPKTWDDLTKPEYKGLIAISNPTTAGTAYTALVTLLLLKGEEKGWEYLAKLHKNVAQYTKSGSAAGQLAGQGEVAIGIVFLHDVVMFAEEGFPVKAVAPADGTGYEIGGISLIKGAPHMANAKKFIDWALTPDVQAIAKDFRSFQLQSNKNTPLPPVVIKHGVDFENVKTIKYDFLWGSKNRERIIKRWAEQIFSQAR
ncbi:MAG: ABC transporter substrate-binding protein [candidate division NC10 bacterium]|nr:ABC transporter substrate-binding protein [candidate division NC10 bacterium]